MHTYDPECPCKSCRKKSDYVLGETPRDKAVECLENRYYNMAMAWILIAFFDLAVDWFLEWKERRS